MPSMSKAKLEHRRNMEKMLVATLHDKIDALASAQLKEDKEDKKSDYKIVNEYTKHNKKKKTSKHSIEQLRKEIHLLLVACELYPHKTNPTAPETTREEKWMIHLDWEGLFRKPDDTDFSAAYARHRHLACESIYMQSDDPVTMPTCSPDEYDLEKSPAWQKMRKFENFASCRGKICNQMATLGVPPEIVPTMNFFDFSEVLYLWQKERKTKSFECSRSKNLKMFEACYGDDFEKILTMLRYKPQYINKVREDMRKGLCDPLLNFHHKTNVYRIRECKEPHEANLFANTMLTFVHPHHRCLHFGNGYDLHDDLAFFGGFDPLFQIKRDPEREREYLNNPKKFMKKNAGNNR